MFDHEVDKIYKAYLTRKVTFSAAHRLHSKKLNDVDNQKMYGPCNHINGHGHNYVVIVTVYGPVDSETGMVLNLTDLKSYMEVAIMSKLDHKNLDIDVPYFKERPSTVENLTIFIWHSLKEVMRQPDLLHEVKVYETEKNVAIYKGE